MINEGRDVLLFLDSKRTYLVKMEKGRDFHTHKGYIHFDEVIGKKYGQRVSSSLGYEFILFKPNLYDYMRKMRHATQIIYPKDIALIMLYSNIGSGHRIVEAGTGSGVLTSALAHFVKPCGKIYSYEVRKEFLETAKKNLKRAGVIEYVELKNKDIILGIDENEVDSVMLDLATPWLVVPVAHEALKSGGKFVTFSPTIEQVVKTVNALERKNFIDIETVENILRRIKVKAGKTRPETLMIGHTGYLTHARKTIK